MKNKYALILRLALVALVGSIGSAFAQSATTDNSNISAQEIAARQANLRDYFHRLEEKRNPVMTRTLPNGDVADFVPRDPNAPTPPVLHNVKDSPQPLSWFQKNPALKGPPGTVPYARFDIEGYLSHVKVPPKDPTGMFVRPYIYNAANQETETSLGIAYLYHVIEKHQALNEGATSGGDTIVTNFWKTYGPVPDIANPNILTHTLFELAVAAPHAASYQDTIEWGYTQDEGLNGTENIDANGNQQPYFFCFFTTNYYGPHGDNIGGYNANQAGYNQYTNELGPGFTAVWGSSVYQGSQTEIQWTVLCSNYTWWLYVGSIGVGYYDQSIFHSSNGLGIGVFSTLNYDYTCNAEVATGADLVDGNGMGSGVFPIVSDEGTQNYTRSAYVRDFGSINTPFSSTNPLNPLEIDDPGCYNATTLFYSSSPGLSNFWYYGGWGNAFGNTACLP